MDPSVELKKKVQIVLVEPEDGANIGSVCRAMKAMGLSRLALVTDRFYDEQRIFTLALHAKDIYLNARQFSSLSDALKDSTMAIASTRRHGKKRKSSFLTPKDLTDIINKASSDDLISVVFGRESDGLTDAEIADCNAIVTIPTSADFPSLNLSQAVQIITSSIYQAALPYTGNKKSVTIERQREVTDHIEAELNKTNYFKGINEIRNTKVFLQDIIGRATMTEGEIKYMDKIFTKLVEQKIHED